MRATNGAARRDGRSPARSSCELPTGRTLSSGSHHAATSVKAAWHENDTYFAPDTVLDISVHLPEQTFYGQATVRYCKELETENEYIMGVQFVFDD